MAQRTPLLYGRIPPLSGWTRTSNAASAPASSQAGTGTQAASSWARTSARPWTCHPDLLMEEVRVVQAEAPAVPALVLVSLK